MDALFLCKDKKTPFKMKLSILTVRLRSNGLRNYIQNQFMYYTLKKYISDLSGI